MWLDSKFPPSHNARMRRYPSISTLLSLALLLPCSMLRADVTPNALFSDHAVLQQGVKIPIWGQATPGETVTVSFAGQSASTTAQTNGTWQLQLPALEASATPCDMVIEGGNRIVIHDLLVGEVWICSGQSNMERQLGPRDGQQPIVGWEAEVASANYPEIRQFYVPQSRSFDPQSDTHGTWSVCSPDTAQNITAVGYFFGRDLHKARGVPVGLIHSSWGGTAAEAWTSREGLASLPNFVEPLQQVDLIRSDPASATATLLAQQEQWYHEMDPGTQEDPAWSQPGLQDSNWESMQLPTTWEMTDNYPTFNGVFWFRKTFFMPEDWDGKDVEINLGAVDDVDTTWVNGEWIGSTPGWDVARIYTLAAGLLHPGQNVIAVRVLDTGGGGGLWGNHEQALQLHYHSKTTGQPAMLSLAGTWACKPGISLEDSGWPPVDFSQSASAPTCLYHAMIHPLLPFPIRGVIWYQGEANVGKEKEYQSLFPAMIRDWRNQWKLGDFPFLFVQIAPHREMSPEIREAQLLTLQQVEQTAMVVTMDCGDAVDIHPSNKEPVGARLALAARALAYGEAIAYSGPIYKSARFEGNQAIVDFTETANGLVAPGADGSVRGFTLAGKDDVFYPATAKIEGETVVVTCAKVKHPVAVRYGWANVPEGNLFNRQGLPASPFRSDIQ